ncbi:MAG: hypothetical protein A2283_03175 [Lentisphaerae bacterium RIFOXYA12_FULL_48_11]|nr:MAG: hypothetical protein A2283_03175 [Lentisphaerae bacterium RIFOXYA12_FULL_48_11]
MLEIKEVDRKVMLRLTGILVFRLLFCLWIVEVADGASDRADISLVSMDLTVPPVVYGEPVPGKRVLQALPQYSDSNVRHAMYLPTDWKKGKTYPVIMEYAGNGRVIADGTPCLGYGISGGTGFIWVCLPYVSQDRKSDMKNWWGDVNATVAYCKETVRLVCREWGGDAGNVFISGFSRGSIACNVIGMHDDEIAGLWKGFICHSHYDDGRWSGTDAAGAVERIKRLGRKPQFISNEVPVVEKERIEEYLRRICPQGRFTFVTLPYFNHTETWVLRDIRERDLLREWLRRQITSEKDEAMVVPLWPGQPSRFVENVPSELQNEHEQISRLSIPSIAVHVQQ